ncbi:MAG: carbamoyl-phosphate synthase large subunit [Cytophagales bacterium]|nr:carbamoyl-phosphate synthase large subunit [Cytophagales bacterium]
MTVLAKVPHVLVIGSGPIIIGQACEFDYSGTQAIQSLKEEGLEITLLNSNPATIMTDSTWADHVYLKPIEKASVKEILQEHKINLVLPTVGGQVALNLAMACEEQGLWKKYGVKMIGVDSRGIAITEDRERFREEMIRLNIPVPRSEVACSVLEGREIAQRIQFPLILRSSYTLGGWGGSIVRQAEGLEDALHRALKASPVHKILVEESIEGWKEFELEILCDRIGNFVVVCCIENVDPMGIHTGDSITVAPALTLSDTVYQKMRNMAKHIVRGMRGFTGGCNIQFAVHPQEERVVVIEMNPRVSRSSALASKATGYPIARIAVKLALDHTLDQIKNPVTGNTSAFFEPTLDYVVVKIPRWNFDKFREADASLGLQMKAVGEVMALGKHFQEALSKAIHSLEIQNFPVWEKKSNTFSQDEVMDKLKNPSWDRLFYLLIAFRMGISREAVYKATKIDPWFLYQLTDMVETMQQIEKNRGKEISYELLREAKSKGFTDQQIAHLLGIDPEDVDKQRKSLNIKPTYQQVDTCGGEFEANTSYHYSTFGSIRFQDSGKDVRKDLRKKSGSSRRKVVILGSGPNRIGQGIEFDYCCVHGSLALKEMGYESIMINCNPETVSTDADISDALYFEPVQKEYVKHIIDEEKPEGVIVQFGGQTALKLAKDLNNWGIPILGTCFESMDIAEDRVSFSDMLKEHKISHPEYGIIRDAQSALELARSFSFPLLIRPSYVLGGESMKIVVSEQELEEHVVRLLRRIPNNRIMLDRFIDGAKEAEIDALCDGEDLHVMGIVQHVEPAGIHSGDSYGVLPPYDLNKKVLETMENHARRLAIALKIKGFINIQFVIQDDEVYVIEANPRASRTVPFICKAHNQAYVNQATQIIMNRSRIRDFKFSSKLSGYAIKEPVFSFDKFPGVNKKLGPEMKSTGEAIRFIPNLEDPYFVRLYKERNLYLSR